jgi:2-oxoglutarate ferredoxin oxidoreductase subunit alpha
MSGEKIEILSGNETAVLGALAAGCTFFAGYPITPSSEIAEEMSRILPKTGGVFVQMEDEIASIAAIIGASLTGRKAMTATSGPGFSLMMENIGYAVMAEVPCVIVNIMRGGPSTGLPTKSAQGDLMQARWGSHGDYRMIALAPWSVREMYDCMVKAFNFSEQFRQPVIVLGDEIVGHMSENVVLPEVKPDEIVRRRKPDRPHEQYKHYDESLPCAGSPMASFGEGWRFNVTGLTHDEEGIPTNDPAQIERCHRRLIRKVDERLDEVEWLESGEIEGADVVLAAFGSIGRSAAAAAKKLRAQGVKAGLFRPVIVWPFPEKRTEKLLANTRLIVAAEMNDGQMAQELRKYTDARIVRVNRLDGEMIPPSDIAAAALENLKK